MFSVARPHGRSRVVLFTFGPHGDGQHATNLPGVGIQFDFRNSPRRIQPKMTGTVPCLALVGSSREDSTKPTINPDGPKNWTPAITVERLQ